MCSSDLDFMPKGKQEIRKITPGMPLGEMREAIDANDAIRRVGAAARQEQSLSKLSRRQELGDLVESFGNKKQQLKRPVKGLRVLGDSKTMASAKEPAVLKRLHFAGVSASHPYKKPDLRSVKVSDVVRETDELVKANSEREARRIAAKGAAEEDMRQFAERAAAEERAREGKVKDRKSTRLNSSH